MRTVLGGIIFITKEDIRDVDKDNFTIKACLYDAGQIYIPWRRYIVQSTCYQTSLYYNASQGSRPNGLFNKHYSLLDHRAIIRQTYKS